MVNILLILTSALVLHNIILLGVIGVHAIDSIYIYLKVVKMARLNSCTSKMGTFSICDISILGPWENSFEIYFYQNVQGVCHKSV